MWQEDDANDDANLGIEIDYHMITYLLTWVLTKVCIIKLIVHARAICMGNIMEKR